MHQKNLLKILIILGIILLILIGVLAFSSMSEKNITGETINEYSYTRAFCDENNLCQDYEISCQDEKILDIKATGFIVQNPKNWRDSRNPEDIEQFCNIRE